MTYQDHTDESDAAQQLPDAVVKISDALRALHIDPDGGGAIERPAIAAGRLLAAAEILARSVMSSPGDLDGRERLDDLMHGFYGMVVAFSNTMPAGTSSALRGALLQDRLRRAEKQSDLAGEADYLTSVLHQAIEEAGRLRTQSDVL
ncbi:hypothetical protein ACFYRN_40210 [Streptomyces sp. NPDC005227]|uniref:hypothetical protein n=1 Tax=Streptomyces sp. NPDC005227 TaxID=3364707 RepID=UPI0036CA50CA